MIKMITNHEQERHKLTTMIKNHGTRGIQESFNNMKYKKRGTSTIGQRRLAQEINQHTMFLHNRSVEE